MAARKASSSREKKAVLDLLIYVVGYEQRSGFIANGNLAPATSRVGLVFCSHHECSFTQNFSAAQVRGDELIDVGDGSVEFCTLISDAIERSRMGLGSRTSLRVGLDVSSMTRVLMAHLIGLLFVKMGERQLSLTLLYATAKYQQPPEDSGPFVDFQPIAGCEGWTLHPERPLSVVLGLGYEADQAVGAVEYLDPSGIWAFVPNGDDTRFHRDLNRANEALWPILEPSHRLEYWIANPSNLYVELRGLVETLARRSRVILVPGGPKIFSALALLVKFEVGDEVSVWRASTHRFRNISDVQASGAVTRFEYPKRRLVANYEVTGDLGN
jgi:hypothetical protein